MVKGQGAVDNIVWMDLGHQVHSLLEAEVPHVLDVTSLGQPGSARCVDIAGLVCDGVPKKDGNSIIMVWLKIAWCTEILLCKNDLCC